MQTQHTHTKFTKCLWTQFLHSNHYYSNSAQRPKIFLAVSKRMMIGSTIITMKLKVLNQRDKTRHLVGRLKQQKNFMNVCRVSSWGCPEKNGKCCYSLMAQVPVNSK